jgi:hypothetical protein
LLPGNDGRAFRQICGQAHRQLDRLHTTPLHSDLLDATPFTLLTSRAFVSHHT